MDLFRDGTPEDIAARLEASVDTQPDRQADRQPDRMPDMRFGVVYKGVTFPT